MKELLLRAAGLLLTTTMILALFTACGTEGQDTPPPDDGQKEASLSFTPETLPAIDGSTALAPYYEAVAAKLMGMDVEEARQYVECNTTHEAYLGLIQEKDKDIIFCSPPSEEELAMAETAGVELEVTPILNGGFVFFVNKDNPVDSLTIDQLHDIYAGDITNWEEVGGEDKEIIAYQRAANSGSQTGLYKYIIPEDEVMEAPTEKVIADMGGIVDAVAAYSNSESALGYSYYYYVANMYGSENIKLLKIDGIEPNNDTIASGEYPITTNSNVIIRGDEPEDSPARQMLAWILSDEGQALAEENGYVRKGN